MGKLQIRYPFIQNNTSLLTNGWTDSNNKKLFTGEKNIGSNYGAYTFLEDTEYTGGITIRYTPSFFSNKGFHFFMSYANAPDGILKLDREGDSLQTTPSGDTNENTMFMYSTDIGNGVYGRDYTKIPLVTYETNSSYLFAIDKFTNFFMVTERKLIDDPTVKACSIITRKTVGESDDCALGLYEFNDMGTSTDSTKYSNLYTNNNLYNAPNVGYCNTYSLYQYTRDGYIYPDIYYCDGGLSVPPDGIVRIGTTKFMKLGANLFIKLD